MVLNKKPKFRGIFTRLKRFCARKEDLSPPYYMKGNPAYERFDVGKGTYGVPTVKSWGEGATLHIGKFCSIADEVVIFLGGEHRVDWITTYPFSTLWLEGKGFPGHPRTKGDVSIGNDVWIGYGAIILSGVNIGHGAVIGAGSVVASNVRPYEIVAGNPARHVRFRFSDMVIDRLCRVAWWDWPESKIEATLPFLLSGNVAEFLNACDQVADQPRDI